MPTTRTSTAIREALEHLASIDLIELCNEAKIERCRATRDLSSCGRYVQHVLTACGHASLCAECSQRCDVCPICRTLIPSDGSRLRFRLYYKCIEAGLISKRHDERFQEKNDSRGRVMADIQRLYSLFDVALENNLVSLICHYVTDVCMDENAVSSDPVLAFLLDEVVVKDWCKQTFNNTIYDLQGKYCLGAEEMMSQLCSLQKLAVQLTGIANVLEVMVSSIKETFSGPLRDLHQLLESTLKAKQHLGIMVWCTRHKFLENVQPHYSNHRSWIFQFHEKKAAAVKRTWPDVSSYTTDSFGSKPTLFIEEALSNLGLEQTDSAGREEVNISCLQDGKSSLILQSSIDETNGNDAIAYYPFENVRAATDILFLHGTSDMVVAKHAIFLYYLYDRHWTRPDAEWRYLVDDFASSFGISRSSVLESLTFYLLDDHMDQAVEEATHLLSEIASPETHPKIAQVLLERQRPDLAMAVLRCSGRDGFSIYPKSEHDDLLCISLNEAITAVRVRIECGLLTESFMYQRMHCSKLKELASRKTSSVAFSGDSKLDSWAYQVEVLVTEICQLCIRRNLVDRMIELPWNSEEEKFLHKCLFEHACQNLASIYGSLLVVFYLQREDICNLDTAELLAMQGMISMFCRLREKRHRYIEAYQVDCKLQSLEQNFSETANEDILCRINSISHWRSGLVEKSLELLPEEQRRQAMADGAADSNVSIPQDVQMPSELDFTNTSPDPVTILTLSSAKSSLVLQKSVTPFPRKSSADGPTNFISSISNSLLESGKRAPSVLQHRLLSSLGSPAPRMSSLIDGVSSANPYNRVRLPPLPNDYNSKDVGWSDVRQRRQSVVFSLPSILQSATQSMPLSVLKGSASETPLNGHQFRGENAMKLNAVAEHAENSQTQNSKITGEEQADLMDIFHSNGVSKESTRGLQPKNSQNFSNRPRTGVFPGESTMGVFLEESTLSTRSSETRDSPAEDSKMRTGSRWRSDESSEDEAEHGVDRHMTGGILFANRRRARSSRR